MSRRPEPPTLRLGVSSCLLGAKVRFDGAHKHNRFLTDVLAEYVEWVPICPEVEAGMGVPRESVRLVGPVEAPRMVGVRSETDYTATMRRFAARRVRELTALDLDGFVLKKGSPSCGMERVRVYRKGMPSRNGRGVFSTALVAAYPLLPVEEEGRLNDPGLRENFIERLFGHRRWCTLVDSRPTHHDLVAFHTAHEHLLRAHSPEHHRALGRIVAHQKGIRPEAAVRRYGAGFMTALSMRATRRKHTNTLHHIAGHCRDHLAHRDREELAQIIGDYHRGLVPLIVPITLLRHHIARNDIPSLRDQVYLQPDPKELMLRNHV